MSAALSDQSRKLSPERRARILDAARYLILRQGLRATTMEAIAREARIAKPTLYGYFADKDAVFGALIAEIGSDIHAAVEGALAGEGDVASRIAAALSAKYRVINKVLQGSPHAGELYDEHTREGTEAFSGLDGWVEAAISKALSEAGVTRPRPLAQLVLAAAFGVGRKAQNPAEIGPALRLLVERLVRPELEGSRQ
jgi:AcrR family transcriptional regulator